MLAGLPRLALRRRRFAPLYAPLRPALGSDLRVLDLAHGSMWRRRLDRRVGSLESARSASTTSSSSTGCTPRSCRSGSRRVGTCRSSTGRCASYPFQDFWRGRLLALGYRLADQVIITNPDVVAQARLLGLEERSYTFVPHPLDETKYCPGPSELRAEVERDGFDFLLLCPSRHDWHVKGLDRLLRAFAEFVRSDRPNALLLLFDWGPGGRSQPSPDRRSSGSSGNVRWSPPLPKLRLIDAYRAADVVLDQFLIGTFGAVAPGGDGVRDTGGHGVRPRSPRVVLPRAPAGRRCADARADLRRPPASGGGRRRARAPGRSSAASGSNGTTAGASSSTATSRSTSKRSRASGDDLYGLFIGRG